MITDFYWEIVPTHPSYIVQGQRHHSHYILVVLEMVM